MINVLDFTMSKMTIESKAHYYGLYIRSGPERPQRLYRTFKISCANKVTINTEQGSQFVVRLQECLTNSTTYCEVIKLVF